MRASSWGMCGCRGSGEDATSNPANRIISITFVKLIPQPDFWGMKIFHKISENRNNNQFATELQKAVNFPFFIEPFPKQRQWLLKKIKMGVVGGRFQNWIRISYLSEIDLQLSDTKNHPNDVYRPDVCEGKVIAGIQLIQHIPSATSPILSFLAHVCECDIITIHRISHVFFDFACLNIIPQSQIGMICELWICKKFQWTILNLVLKAVKLCKSVTGEKAKAPNNLHFAHWMFCNLLQLFAPRHFFADGHVSWQVGWRFPGWHTSASWGWPCSSLS